MIVSFSIKKDMPLIVVDVPFTSNLRSSFAKFADNELQIELRLKVPKL